MTPQGRTIAFINLAHLLDHLLMLVFPTAVLGMGGDFGLDFAELLPLATGAFIAFGAGSLPAGWLADRWNRRDMLALFFLGSGLAAVLTGFAQTPVQLAASLTVLGLFAAIYHPVGTALLVDTAPRLGRAIGANGVWGNVGVAGAALLTGTLVELAGWRMAFFVPGTVAFAAGLAFLVAVPRRQAPRPVASGTTDSGRVRHPSVTRAFIILGVTTLAGGVAFSAATVSMPKLFQERLAELAASPATLGLLVAGVFLFGAVAQLIVGRWIDGMPLRRVFLPLALLLAPCMLAAAYAQGWLLVLPAAGLMFALFGQVTVNDALVARYARADWRGRIYALRYLLSFTASASALPLVAWLHGGADGFQSTYQILAVFGLAVLIAALFLPGTRPGTVPQPAG